MNYVGIDYHEKYSIVRAIDEKGHMIRTTRLDNVAIKTCAINSAFD